MAEVKGNFSFVSADDLRPHLGENLRPYAQDFVEAGREYGLDPRFLAAISKLETGNGTSPAFRRGNNAMGISNSRGPLYNFKTPRESIFRQARSLARPDGYYKGAKTIEEIGRIYAPPGAGNDPRGTNSYWPRGVGKFYAEMISPGERDQGREQGRAASASGGDRLPLRARRTQPTDTLERTGVLPDDVGTVMESGTGVPMRDATNMGRMRDTAPAAPQEPAATESPGEPYRPPVMPWSEIRKSNRYRHASQKERRQALEKWQGAMAPYLEGQPEEVREKFRRKSEVERYRIEVEDPEATILDAFRRGLLNTQSATELFQANEATKQINAATGNLQRVRMKLRPGEALYYGTGKSLDLPEGAKARILVGTPEAGIYAVPPETKGAMDLEEFTVWSENEIHQQGQRRQKALEESIARGDLAKALPQSREVREFMKTKGGKASAKVLVRNLVPIAVHTMAESAPSIVAPVAGSTLAGLTGAASGSFAVEYAHSFRHFLEEEAAKQGIDVNTPEGLTAALEDPRISEIAESRAAKRAAPIAGIDAVSMGLAGLLAKKIAGKTAGRIAARGAVQVAFDAPAGAGGELAAQAASGQPIDPKAATLEAIGQVATGSVGTLAKTLRAAKRGQSADGNADASTNQQGGTTAVPPRQEGGRAQGTYESAQPSDFERPLDLTPQPIPDTATGAPGLGDVLGITPERQAEIEGKSVAEILGLTPGEAQARQQGIPPAGEFIQSVENRQRPLTPPDAEAGLADPGTPEGDVMEGVRPYHPEEEVQIDPVPLQPGDIQSGLTDPGTTEGDIRNLVRTPKEQQKAERQQAQAERRERKRIEAKMKSLDRADTPVLNFLRERPIQSANSREVMGRLASISKALRTGRKVPAADLDWKASYDGQPKTADYPSAVRKYMKGLFRKEGGTPPNEIAAEMAEAGIPGVTDEVSMYEALKSELQGLQNAYDRYGSVPEAVDGMTPEEAGKMEQDERFARASSPPATQEEFRKNLEDPEGTRAVQAYELSPGDVLTIDGVEAVVTANQNGRVRLEDGREFGTQVIDADEELWVEMWEPAEQAQPDVAPPTIDQTGEGNLFPESDMPFNLAGEETQATRFEVPDRRSQEQVERDAGQSFLVEDDPNMVFSGPGTILLTPTERNRMAATNADQSPNVKMKRGLPVMAFEAKIRAEATKAGLMKKMQQTERKLRRALKKAAGRSEFSIKGAAAHDNLLRQVNRVLNGELPIGRLPEPLQPVAAEMRALVDRLSQTLIDAGIVEGDVAAAIAENKGVYLNRSYRVFDDPGWARKVPEEIRNRAKGLLREQYPKQQGETTEKYTRRIDGLLEALLFNRGPGIDGPMAVLSESSDVARMVQNILKKRGDIPPELRALWGEYQTADVNFARTIAKQAQLIGSHQFLTEVRDTGLNRYLFEEPRPGFGRQIVKPQGPLAHAMEPIAGLYTTPEIAAAFESLFARNKVAGWVRVVGTINSFAKVGKTVHNPITQVRNFKANPLISLAMGNLPINPKFLGRSAKAYITELLPQGVVDGLEKTGFRAQQWRDYVAKLTSLGVLDESVAVNDLQATIKDAMGGKVTMDEFLQNQFARAGRKALSVPMKFYAAGDGFWKIYNFEAEKGKLRRAFPERSEADLDAEAAMLVRDLMPTYSMIPRFIQNMRQFLFMGTFISFWSEMFRTQVNIVKRINYELGTDGYRSIGARRLAGLVSAYGVIYGVQAAGRAYYGMKKEEEEALRRLAAPWDQNAMILPMGRDDKGNWQFINLSYTDPYAQFKRTFLAMMRDDLPTDEDRLKAALGELFGPIVQEELGTEAIIDIMRNKKGSSGAPLWNENAPDHEKVQAAMWRMWEAVEPGWASSGRRMKKAVTGEKSRSGSAYTLEAELRALMTGDRIVTMDPINSLSYRASDFRRGWAESSGLFSSVAGNRGTVTADEIRQGYENMMHAKGRLMNDLTKDMRAAIRLGETAEEVTATVIAAGAGKDNAELALVGKMRGYQMSDALFKKASLIPGRLAVIRQAVGDQIFTPRQLEQVQNQMAAGMIVAPGVMGNQ